MATRLGLVIPNMTDGTSFYRGAGPLAAMIQGGDQLELESKPMIDWVWMRGVSGVFMQRPFLTDHVRIMMMAKTHGKKVWVDYDDDLFTVPASNPTHSVYNEKSIHHNIMTILTQADVVSCSTEALRTKFVRILEHVEKAGERNDNVAFKNFDASKFRVIPNAYDEELFGYSRYEWEEELAPASMTVMWRGSNTHDADLAEYTQPLAEAFAQYGQNWTLNFVGSPFWQSIERLEAAGIPADRLLITKPMDPIEYFQYIHAIRPAVMVVPLVDDLFNRSKSNIAWIEAAHAGAMCLAPDWEEWQRPGVINYKDQDDFREKLGQVLRGELDRDQLVRESRDFIRRNLGLERINWSRSDLIRDLCRPACASQPGLAGYKLQDVMQDE